MPANDDTLATARPERNLEMPLQLASPEALKRELGLSGPASATVPAPAAPGGGDRGESAAAPSAAAAITDLDAKAAEYADKLLSFSPGDEPAKQDARASVEGMGGEAQRQATRLSQMLRQPIREFSSKAGEKGDVGNALIQLKTKVEDLDPAKFDFSPGWFSRTMGFLPGVGNPLKRYFTKYESGQTAISAIVASLEKGRDQLTRDSATLREDQVEIRQAIAKLERAIQLGLALDRKVQEKAAALDPEKRQFAEEEILFPLRQRVIDLQQQLAVSQQGVLAMELIVRNNGELARGVNRALSVTISALQTGIAVAVALENQKMTLEKVKAVSDATSDIIANTAARLKTQGAEIQKQASSTTLDMQKLKTAFADIKTALNDVSTFRAAALPQMAQTVLELDQITADAAKTLATTDKANKERPKLQIEG
jgi:uncharacterized protein YaaN involved in tellurite resistance